jgi:hypothetical protein
MTHVTTPRVATRRVGRALVAGGLLGALLAATPATAAPAPRGPDPDAPRVGRVLGARTFVPSARNAPAVETFRRLHEIRKGRRLEQIHHFWGVEPKAGSHDGFQATQSVDPSYRVSVDADFTYTPTIKAAGSCMEITTVYSKAVGNEVWAWDWCGGNGPKAEIKMDQSFLDTYTTTVNGRRAYSVQLVKTSTTQNAWSAYLYNQRTSTWSLFYSKTGTDTSELKYGWNIFEIYATRNPSTRTGYYCTEARNTVFESSAIKLRSGGTWGPATPATSPWEPSESPNPTDYWCPTLKFVRQGANDHWIVRQ